MGISRNFTIVKAEFDAQAIMLMPEVVSRVLPFMKWLRGFMFVLE